MLSNLLKDIAEIGVAINSEAELNVSNFKIYLLSNNAVIYYISNNMYLYLSF